MIITDIETSGVSATKNGMLSLGAVDYFSGETFYGECRLTEGREITPIALEINGFTEEQVRDPQKQSDMDLLLRFSMWAKPRNTKILAGHNIGHFDILFLEEVFERVAPTFKGKFPFSYKTVDLHSLAYARFGESLTHEQICVRLGLASEPKPHNALQGALSERVAFQMLLMHNAAHAVKIGNLIKHT